MSAKIKFILIALLVPLWIYLRWVYRDRLGAFGCFDDCFNIMAGYFLGQGKHLYSEIYFNHQPLMAYISWAIQALYNPQSIYELILTHRLVLIYFFALADVILVLRFGMAGFVFAFFYETTKGFLFGERFLAEALIVYPLIYIYGLFWRKPINTFEHIAVGICAWFVIFSREPYIPLTLSLFGAYIWRYKTKLSLIIFTTLSAATLLGHNISAYWFNVVVVNGEVVKEGLAQYAIFYPIQVFFGGEWNLFRWIEVILFVFLFLSLWHINYKRVFFIFFVLALANIRAVMPGTIYYVGFHHLVYFALLITSVVFLWKRSYLYIAPLIIFAMVSPQSYLHEKVDRADQFGIGYGHYIMQGEIIKRLSQPSQTLFLEEWDDLIYWQAKRFSTYPYSWYTSIMRNFPVYTAAREHMFRTNPPDFYYGQCDGENISLPPYLTHIYLRLTQSGKPLCIFVKKEVASNIPDSMWISVLDFSIDKPR